MVTPFPVLFELLCYLGKVGKRPWLFIQKESEDHWKNDIWIEKYTYWSFWCHCCMSVCLRKRCVVTDRFLSGSAMGDPPMVAFLNEKHLSDRTDAQIVALHQIPLLCLPTFECGVNVGLRLLCHWDLCEWVFAPWFERKQTFWSHIVLCVCALPIYQYRWQIHSCTMRPLCFVSWALSWGVFLSPQPLHKAHCSPHLCVHRWPIKRQLSK